MKSSEEVPDFRSSETESHNENKLKAELHILLVDDNEVNQAIASNYLKKRGYSVAIASTGKEALNHVLNHSFHVILIDIQMPEMDGYEVTRRIRGMDDPYFKAVPIIALTATIASEVKEKLNAAGINDYIIKPFTPATLQEKILKYQPFAVAEAPHKSLQESLDDYSGSNQNINVNLAKLMIKNLQELQLKLDESLQTNDVTHFSSTGHKMATTFGILRNEKFEEEIAEIKQLILLKNELSQQLATKVEVFRSQCEKSIEELSEFYFRNK